jgi:hypothetical protein
MSHPAPFDGCFIRTLASNMFEAEFFGKEAHAVISKKNAVNVGSRTVGRDQCSGCNDPSI